MVADRDTEVSIGKDSIDKVNKEKDKRESRNFVPPTINEVKAYCQERNNGVNPYKWYDFYQSKGWMIGKNKMKDWKAAVRTWEKDSTGGDKDDSKPEWNGFFE